MGGQEFEEFVLHVGEVEGPTFDDRLIGLQVERKRPVFDEFWPGSAACFDEEIPQASIEFARRQRQKTEVVEEFLSGVEQRQLFGRDDD